LKIAKHIASAVSAVSHPKELMLCKALARVGTRFVDAALERVAFVEQDETRFPPKAS